MDIEVPPTGGDNVAVEDVSFTVERGEIFGIVGPNGAGKTTTVEMITGLRRQAGRRNGARPRAGPPGQRRPAARQGRRPAPGERAARPAAGVGGAGAVRVALLEPCRTGEAPRGRGADRQAQHPVREAVRRSKAALFIALALIGDPDIAILGELTTGLDPPARRGAWRLIEKIRDKGVTVVLVTQPHGGGRAGAAPDRGLPPAD